MRATGEDEEAEMSLNSKIVIETARNNSNTGSHVINLIREDSLAKLSLPLDPSMMLLWLPPEEGPKLQQILTLPPELIIQEGLK